MELNYSGIEPTRVSQQNLIEAEPSDVARCFQKFVDVYQLQECKSNSFFLSVFGLPELTDRF